MSEETKKSVAEDAGIPPPLDPFPTYQTPYSRHNTTDNENPFISFRRFADEQFNSFFSGLPQILGVTESRLTQSEVDNRRLEARSSEQASRLEAELNEMIRRRHEEAEGFRKQMEQEREERRMEMEKRNQEEKERWEMMQRGLERCPALKSNAKEPSTELDMYDRLEEQRREEDNRRRDRRWRQEGRRGWFSGLGWDGRGRRGNVQKEDATNSSSQQDLSSLNLEPEDHLADLDPFKHEDDLHAYLTESKYSPIHLMLPNCFAAWRSSTSRPDSNSMSDAPSATELDRRMADRLQWSEAFNDLLTLEKTGELPPREHASIFNMAPFRASVHGPFSDPFSREMKRLIEKTPRRESEDDSFREGDFWDGDIDISPLGTGIMALLMGAALSGIPLRTIGQNKDISKRDTEPEQNKDQTVEPRQADSADVRDIFWPGPEVVLSLIERVRRQELESSSQDERAEENAQAQLSTRDTSSFSSSSTNTSSWSVSNSSNDNPNSIISTLTTTQTRTLSDGTTETKRVLKRRFADGREEQDESVEVRPGGINKTSLPSIVPALPTSSEIKTDHILAHPSSAIIQKAIEPKPKEKEPRKQNSKDKSSEEKGGWFWN